METNEKQKKLLELQYKIWGLEDRKEESQLLKQIKKVKEEMNKIYEDDEEKQTKFIKQRFCESDPRAMKLLA